MSSIKELNLATGIIYRNPIPHVYSRHAYFPSLIMNEKGDLLVSFAIGEAFEAENLNTWFSRSVDGGLSWTTPELLVSDTPEQVSQFARLSYFGNGETVAIINRCLRKDHTGEGLANPQNMGFVPTTILSMTSNDFGQHWTPLREIVPPIEGPCFEMCSAAVKTASGKWIWPTSTWRNWEGIEPNGMKMVAFVSEDAGATWPVYWNVMDRHTEKIIFWESKIVELKAGLLISLAWTYDETNGKDLPVHYAYSLNDGKNWSLPESSPLIGQTVSMLAIDEQRILVVYRRTDQPGLWACVCRFNNGALTMEHHHALWGHRDATLVERSGNMVQDFNELKFGAPSLIKCGQHEYMVAFWCYEKLVSNIRWIKFRLS